LKVKETHIEGCFIIEPMIFEDKRGVFFESFHKQKFEAELGFSVDFVQDNQSISSKNVLRGLHYQVGAHAQAKLVQVIKGQAIDVVVDIRKDSPTFGEHFKILLSDKNHKMIFIPKGMAHGFLAKSDEVILAYKCDNYYNKASERGIIYNDDELAIDWELDSKELVISEKDIVLPTFKVAFS